MASIFRSNVLTREEKGFAGITFPRAMSCVMVGGVGYFLMMRIWPMGALCVSPALFFVAVFLSGNRFGLMRVVWYVIDWKARLAMVVKSDPESRLAKVASQIDLGDVVVNTDELFATRKRLNIDALLGIEFFDEDENQASGVQFLEDEVDFDIDEEADDDR